ncbi:MULTISPECIES: hypothetical protein [unclassified Dietzia]|uniref:hypothetical protein n=1 Tax=unclassified Dietzia TaxID=2617939 RepID=UPI0015F97954|nr:MULTISPECIES: hypothetical protein [unclassified Dietzia]MBB1025489.1 hypothetical protein [Dietzia sp. DQ12-76]MBB1026254.1 hypothetical protein [Dietzia sp. DQ11-38-2]
MGLPTLTQKRDAGPGSRSGSAPGARSGSAPGAGGGSGGGTSTGPGSEDIALSRRRPVRRRAARFWNDALTTPGRMSVFAVVAIVAVLFGGTVASQTITQRQSHHETLLAEVEPVANASQTLYSSLTIADSAANTAFITGGIEPAELRDRYLQAIAASSASIVAASQGLDRSDEESIDQLAHINAQLTTYTGLVETARTNNRVANPVGSAYLASASTLMQDTILPAAADLYDRQSTSVGESDREWSSPPWGSFILLGAAIAILVLLQQWLWKITGRRVNPALALASLLMVATFLLTMIAGFLAANNNARGLSEGAAPMNELTRQRINAQKVRAQETLNLVRRTDPEGSAAERAAILGGVRDTLTVYLDPDEESRSRTSLDGDGAVTNAIEALDEWMAAQNRADSLYQQGDYQGAILISSGQGEGDSGAAFDEFDESMQDAIEEARDTLRTRIDNARRTSATGPDLIMALSALAAFAVIVGIAPRIREYL